MDDGGIPASTTPPGLSRLTPLVNDHLVVATPPSFASSQQKSAETSCKRTKRARRGPNSVYTGPRPNTSCRRRPRAIFHADGEEKRASCNMYPAKLTSGEQTQDAGHTVETIAAAEDVLKAAAMDTPENFLQTNISESGERLSSQDGKKAPVGAVEVSPLSVPQQDKKKWKRGLQLLQSSPSLASRDEVLDDFDRKNTVLKRAVSSQAVFISRGMSPPKTAPTLSRHLSELTGKSKSAVHEPILPTVYSSRHPDLNVITPETVAKVVRGDFNERFVGFELLDCRFPYEFEGGSLQGASLLCDPDSMEEQLFVAVDQENATRTALIFFCEFSANRAPKMLRHVRNVDRTLHVDTYPELYYPELYLIDGGYKNCFETLHKEICAPPVMYVQMNDERFVEDCRQEFAAWRRRWKPHKTVANCATKFQNSTIELDGAKSFSQPTPLSFSAPLRGGETPASQSSVLSHGVRSLFDEL